MFMFAADAKQRPAPRFTLQLATTAPRAKWLGALGSLAQQAPDRPSLDPIGGREIELGTGATGGLGADATAVFNRDFVDEPPVLLSSPRLEYPRLLLRAGVEGTVVIEVVIDTLGLPERETTRVTASPHAALSAAALDVVGRSRYRPGRLGGRRVRVLVSVPVVFRIER